MPTSIDPQPADDEIECARCGAHFYYELTRCPKCGVNLYEPEDEGSAAPAEGKDRTGSSPGGGILAGLDHLIHRLTGKPYPADELFGAAINQAELFNNLLLKAGGDRAAAERLIDFERRALPEATRLVWLENAIRRWERDNRAPSGK
jgi:predicted  nucleic acid-binding Zn-ribbon protein